MKKKEDGYKNPVERFRAKHKEVGLCIYCSRPRSEKSKTLCDGHLLEARVYQARVRACFKKYGNLMGKIEKNGEEI